MRPASSLLAPVDSLNCCNTQFARRSQNSGLGSMWESSLVPYPCKRAMDALMNQDVMILRTGLNSWRPCPRHQTSMYIFCSVACTIGTPQLELAPYFGIPRSRKLLASETVWDKTKKHRSHSNLSMERVSRGHLIQHELVF